MTTIANTINKPIIILICLNTSTLEKNVDIAPFCGAVEALSLLSNNKKSITYQFLDSTIVRYGLIETTFDLIPKDLDLKTEIESEKVTNFNLEVVNNRQSFLFSYIKDYGKKDLIINTLNNN